jgi:NitT/TauT family transport system ATP-binding protein
MLGPGRIEREYTIDLPRPHEIARAEFNDWRQLPASRLRGELSKQRLIRTLRGFDRHWSE